MWCKGLLKKQEAGRLVVTQSTRTPSVKTAGPLCNQFCHVPETATQTSKSFQFLRDLAKNESCTVAFSSYFESRCWTKENWKPLLHAQQLLRLKTHQLEAGWLRYDWVPTSPTILKTADFLLLAEVTLSCGTHIRPGSKSGAAGDVLSGFHLSLTLRDYLYVSRRLAQIFNEVLVFLFCVVFVLGLLFCLGGCWCLEGHSVVMKSKLNAFLRP